MPRLSRVTTSVFTARISAVLMQRRALSGSAVVVRRVPEKGRCLFLQKSVDAGEEILSETALAVVPYEHSWNQVCWTCCRPLRNVGETSCRRCGSRFCSSRCASPQHHVDCTLVPHLVKTHRDRAGGVWSMLRTLMSASPALQPSPLPVHILHASLRVFLRLQASTADAESVRSSLAALSSNLDVVAPALLHRTLLPAAHLLNALRLHAGMSPVEVPAALHMLGVHLVNSFALIPPSVSHFAPPAAPVAMGVFAQASMLAHSCRPNCSYSPHPDRFTLSSNHGLPAGAELTIPYVSLVLPTRRRRERLLDSKHFWCMCPRCTDEALRDPLEAWNCPSCAQPQYYVPASSDPPSSSVAPPGPATAAHTTPAPPAASERWRCSSCARSDDWGPLEARVLRDADTARLQAAGGQVNQALLALRALSETVHERCAPTNYLHLVVSAATAIIFKGLADHAPTRGLVQQMVSCLELGGYSRPHAHVMVQEIVGRSMP